MQQDLKLYRNYYKWDGEEQPLSDYPDFCGEQNI